MSFADPLAECSGDQRLDFLNSSLVTEETPASEIELFFKAMSAKVTKENLTVDQMDEFQETILNAINTKLRQFRNESDSN